MRAHHLLALAPLLVPSVAHASGAALVRVGAPAAAEKGTFAEAVSRDGAVVVGSANTAQGIEAFRWTATGGLELLGDLPGGSVVGSANDVSEDGLVIVGTGMVDHGAGDTLQAFRWTAASGLVGLEDLEGGSLLSVAQGTDATGTVIVGHSYGWFEDLEACRWTGTGAAPQALGFLEGGRRSSAVGVSADGTTIIGSSAMRRAGSEHSLAFRSTPERGLESLGDLPGGVDLSYAADVSADGLVVVGSAGSAASGDNYLEAWRWKFGGNLMPLGDLPGGPFGSDALGVSADGRLVVGRSVVNDDELEHAFVWTEETGLVDLNDLLDDEGVARDGYVLAQARDVSPEGRWIVGNGLTPDGHVEAFRLRLPDAFFADTPDAGAPDGGSTGEAPDQQGCGCAGAAPGAIAALAGLARRRRAYFR